MLRRFILSLVALALVAGCDSTTVLSGTENVFRTEGTDYPYATAALPTGRILVGALVEGTIAPTDGTLGFPAVVGFNEGDTEAAVYDGDEPDFFGVGGIAPLENGLAIAIGSDDGVRLYRTDRDGRGRRSLARIEDARYLPDDALHAVPGGLVLAVYATEAGGPHLYGLTASGDERWTYRLPEAQDVRAVSVRPDGDLVVVGPGRRGGEAIVARLSPDGEERWRRELAQVSPVDVSASAEGAVVVGQSEPGGAPWLVRLDADGEDVWARGLGSDPRARATRAVLLDDGTIAVGVHTPNEDVQRGNEARVLVLDADGDVRDAVAVGAPRESTTFVQGLVPLPGGRLGVVAAVGPTQIGGYGGDDFDIEVVRLDVTD